MNEDLHDLLWMGYRRTQKDGVYAKPVGRCLLVYTASDRRIASWFIGVNGSPYTWASHLCSDKEPLKDELSEFEAYNIPTAGSDTQRDMGFILPEQTLEIESREKSNS